MSLKIMWFHDTQNAQKVEWNIAIITLNCWTTQKKYSKRKKKHGWTQMNKIETDCIWVILKIVGGPTIFKFMANRLGPVVRKPINLIQD